MRNVPTPFDVCAKESVCISSNKFRIRNSCRIFLKPILLQFSGQEDFRNLFMVKIEPLMPIMRFKTVSRHHQGILNFSGNRQLVSFLFEELESIEGRRWNQHDILIRMPFFKL